MKSHGTTRELYDPGTAQIPHDGLQHIPQQSSSRVAKEPEVMPLNGCRIATHCEHVPVVLVLLPGQTEMSEPTITVCECSWVVLRSNDHLHRCELQNRSVAANAFTWLIWLCPAAFGDFAPFGLLLRVIPADARSDRYRISGLNR